MTQNETTQQLRDKFNESARREAEARVKTAPPPVPDEIAPKNTEAPPPQ